MIDYDEFALFGGNIEEFGLDRGAPTVTRVDTVVNDTDGGPRAVSALRWGTSSPEFVLVHGGAQNAHTWDTVALCLDRPVLAIDLPGHGHSDWRDDGAYSPVGMADDLALVIATHAPDARVVVGMSLGGLTSMELAARHPELVQALVLVDITPGVNAEKTKAVTDFVDGPQSFASFDDLMDRTKQFNPTRSEASLRRGILHNARQLEDDSWEWRYDRGSHARARAVSEPAVAGEAAPPVEDASVAPMSVLSPLWDDFASIRCPVLLVRGSLSPVVDDDDVAEARRRLPGLTVEVVDGAGHSVQGDRPVELASLIEAWLDAQS